MQLSRRKFLSSWTGILAGNALYHGGAKALELGAPLELKSFSNTLNRKDLNRNAELKRFCFGSCNSHKKDQPLWRHISRARPDLFVWLGDIVYGDTEDMNELREKYLLQLSKREYREIVENIPIIATWDDHDFGKNNGDRHYPKRWESREAFFDFIGEGKTSERRSRQGVYDSYTIGPDGRQVKFIMFDCRFNRDSREESNCDILGEEQWKWFEEEMRTSTANIHFFGCSTSMISANLSTTEDWGDFPNSYKRFFDIIERYDVKAPYFLSGDKHFAGFFHKSEGNQGTVYHEMMSSGMTHAVPSVYVPVVNHYYGKANTYCDLNFGDIVIDWEGFTPRMLCRIRGTDGLVKLQRLYEIDQITGKWVWL